MAARTISEHADAVRALVEPALVRVAEDTPEAIGIGDAALAGRVAAAPLHSAIPLPPFDNSQMDGYAVRSEEIAALLAAGSPIARVPVGLTQAAGDPPIDLAPGTASPVMTGAPIPRGADAVIPIEQADPARFTALVRASDAGAPEEIASVTGRNAAIQGEANAPLGTVGFSAAPAPGTFVRPAGSDLPVGEILVDAGLRLTPARIGLLANAGIAEVPVRRRPRILLLATGDEVASPGETPGPGRIFDANGPLLSAALRGAGAEVLSFRVTDRPEAVTELLAAETRTRTIDLVVTSGGISAGAFEVIREALAPLGVAFLGVAMQPGGPQGLGSLPDGAPVLCFPGNPVSSALSAETFLLPLLRAFAGRPARRTERLTLAAAVVSPAEKHQLRRGRLDADGRVRVTPPSSHLLADLAAAELIAHIPLGVTRLEAGDPIEVWRLDD